MGLTGGGGGGVWYALLPSSAARGRFRDDNQRTLVPAVRRPTNGCYIKLPIIRHLFGLNHRCPLPADIDDVTTTAPASRIQMSTSSSVRAAARWRLYGGQHPEQRRRPWSKAGSSKSTRQIDTPTFRRRRKFRVVRVGRVVV